MTHCNAKFVVEFSLPVDIIPSYDNSLKTVLEEIAKQGMSIVEEALKPHSIQARVTEVTIVDEFVFDGTSLLKE